MYPKIIVDLEKLKHNSKIIAELCYKNKIIPAAVTKVYCGRPEIAQASIDGGIKILADSRIQNLKKMKDLDATKMYMRIPMECELEDVVKYADISLNSELYTIKKLSEISINLGVRHDIILMVDLGDLREGVWPNDVLELTEEIIELEGINLIGIGTNLTCYGGVIPSIKNLSQLVDLAKQIEKKYNIKLNIISGGNSSSVYLLENGKIPEGINNLRIGESIVLGTEAAYGRRLDNTYEDVFLLAAQIVEIKEKPSIPIGEIGVDAFGNKPVFEDRGIRKRAILAVGRQDLNPEKIIPIDKDIIILGASSDHLILDITDCKDEYKIGDEIRFTLKYPALLQLFTSEYVYKEIK